MERQLPNTEAFSGKAEVYAAARPSYPDTAIEYIKSLVPKGAIFADVGAGTGKFTECLARHSLKLLAVEPNDDMREQLAKTLANYPDATIVAGTAEATTIADSSVDAVTCAQALHWFNPDDFRAECRRILKPGGIVIAVYNRTLEREREGKGDSRGHIAIENFFTNLTVREFDNPVSYNRESWVKFMLSHSRNPLPTDPEYAAHIEEVNAIFDEKNVEGLLHREMVTKVYHEVI